MSSKKVDLDLEIRTWGEKVHSPYPSRSKVFIEYNVPLRTLAEYEPLFRYNCFIKQPRYPTYDEYIKSFCKYCKRETFEGAEVFVPCLRHDSVTRIPFQLSNHEYHYHIELEPSRFYAEALVGAGGWEFKLEIVEKKAEATIRRPSGVTFTYRGEGEQPIRIARGVFVADPLYLKTPRSIFYLADRFIRFIAWLMNPFEIADYANVYVITPCDEFMIPVRRAEPRIACGYMAKESEDSE